MYVSAERFEVQGEQRMPLLLLIFSAIHNIGLKISHADFVHSGL